MSPISPRDLNRQLVVLNRKRSQFMAERLRSHGLYGPMYSFLLCLEKNPDISQDFLAAYFSIDKGTVARLAKRLEDLAYIRRQTDPDDRRQYQLNLTGRGQEILAVIHENLNDWSARLLEGFNEEDLQTASILLKRMTSNIES
jgi:DNA-binding MarR family transcriptional regulator